MNKQTALQQLNDWVQQEYTSNNRIRLAALIGKIKELQMTTEKEQMIDFAEQWQKRQNESDIDSIEDLYYKTYDK